MRSLNDKLVAALLSAALLVPAASAFGNDWTKPKSRTRGTTIGAAVGALAGPPGAVVGGVIGNGVQRLRQTQTYRHRHHTASYRHRRY
ncbi:MAG TPA: hypothetical protein VKE70_30465 [Candidatus Solibacter sp.]|nr:hypothetical protein [Candidatus Solibacter sp.]